MAGFDQQIAGLEKEIVEKKKLIADVTVYASKRAEITFSALRMNRVEISLYHVVKSTGEWKDAFKFNYSGRRYDRLSLSEKVRAGMELSELVKRLMGRNYPVFVDNMESIDDLENVRPTGQMIFAKCVRRAALHDLSVTEVVEAMDMDQMTNRQVRDAILAMRREVQSIKGIKYSKYTWNPAYKGVDDYLLSRAAGI